MIVLLPRCLTDVHISPFVIIRASTSRPYSALPSLLLDPVGSDEEHHAAQHCVRCCVLRVCQACSVVMFMRENRHLTLQHHLPARAPRLRTVENSSGTAACCRRPRPPHAPVLVAPRSSTVNDSSESQRSNATRKLGPHACDLCAKPCYLSRRHKSPHGWAASNSGPHDPLAFSLQRASDNRS